MPVFKTGSQNTLLMVKPLQTNPNYLILIAPIIKSLMTNFDGFDHNRGSKYVFPEPKFIDNFFLYNRKMCQSDVRKDAVLPNLM